MSKASEAAQPAKVLFSHTPNMASPLSSQEITVVAPADIEQDDLNQRATMEPEVSAMGNSRQAKAVNGLKPADEANTAASTQPATIPVI